MTDPTTDQQVHPGTGEPMTAIEVPVGETGTLSNPPAHAAPDLTTATPGGTVTTYTQKPTTVEAVQYIAPDGADVEGNIADLNALGVTIAKQYPWNPPEGQNCLHIIDTPVDVVDESGQPTGMATVRGPQLVQPGQYVEVLADGHVEVLAADAFTALYS